MKNKSTFGTIGLIIGLFALTSAFTSPWIMNMVSPAPAPEESLVEFALKIKDVAAAKVKGEKYVAEASPKRPRDYVPPSIIGISMLAMMLGVVSLVREEKKTISYTAVLLGIVAAVVQWSILIAGALIFCLLLFIVLGALGLDVSL